jgi:tetratricopeptide (TPR) repeat protein
MSYAGYRGTKYQDPSTWYDPYVYTKEYHTPGPDEPIHNNSPDKQDLHKKTQFVNLFRYILFYATVCMAIVILTKLIIIPVFDNINTENAVSAYLEGKAWMDEGEYQKAIESYTKAITLSADYTEAWREKGYAELAKGVELEQRRPDLARKSYQAALESLRTAAKYDMEENRLDLNTVKNLGNVYERMGMWREAEAVYLKAKEITPDDPEINERLQLIQMYLLGFSSAPSTMPSVPIRTRAIGERI